MHRFTESGREAIKTNNLYAALTLALMIPDICGSLENPGKGKVEARYIRWFKKWAEPKFILNGSPLGDRPWVTANDCFQLRCSIIHTGSAKLDCGRHPTASRFEFCDQTVGSHMNIWMSNPGEPQNHVIQLKVDLFSEALYVSALEWDASVANDANIQEEKQKLLIIHGRDLSIGGFRIG
jgi:hypothetical protein